MNNDLTFAIRYRHTHESSSSRLKKLAAFILLLTHFLLISVTFATGIDSEKFTGSRDCIQCHEKFYELWSTSFHGLAMQPYTSKFSEKNLTAHQAPIDVAGTKYRALIDETSGYVIEYAKDGEKRYKIEHVLGGKNIFYFLTMLDKGRLQVLPLAYDVNRKEWFDTTASAVRHFEHTPDEAIDWRETPLTFNTSCFSCHVSQLSTNYDLTTDTYHTVWQEPGINCETCHGPAAEHVKEYKNAAKTGKKPKKLGLISTKPFDNEQINTMCSNCHAKMRPITSDFMPGERFFDHYDLTALENPDFYPDGRDLGENYTYTGWLMNSCAKSGKLNCIHCHTSSGRNRFEGEKANDACLPCHEDIVNNNKSHSHHSPKSKAGKCISCHMPKTEFGRMIRHDHSFRPPTPKTTIAHKSPNACNICHKSKTPEWADKHVTKWFGKTYQDKTVKVASLIEMARLSDWSKLDEMLDFIVNTDNNEVFTASLIRLLANCPDQKKWDSIRKALDNPSPLVRSAASAVLSGEYSNETRDSLIKAADDKWRLVRIQAAYALSAFPREGMNSEQQKIVEKASDEYVGSLKVRLDNASSHYNIANYYSNRGWFEKAIESYEISSKIDPSNIMPLVNSSIVYARLGKPGKSQTALEKALKIAPDNSEINFNLSLLLAEKGQTNQAKRHMRTALKSDPNFAEAAFNLAIMQADNNIEETIQLCRKAWKLRPENTRYGYTLAYYLYQTKDYNSAIPVLTKMIENPNTPSSAYGLLGAIYKSLGRDLDAMEVYRKGMQDESLPMQERYTFESMLRSGQQQ